MTQNHIISLITNLGQIDIQLDEQNTPDTSLNFLKYVKSGFYENTLFHRVIPDFMIQGGGYMSGMVQKKTDPAIRHEGKNALKNYRGTIAMARTGDPHSATSQFFINLKDNHFLDHQSETSQGWGYCVFGKVVSGMDIVDKIAEQATTNRAGHENVPVQEVAIEKAIINESA